MAMCPACGMDAYVGLSTVECGNEACRHYFPGYNQGKEIGRPRLRAHLENGLKEEDLGFMTVECSPAASVMSLQSTFPCLGLVLWAEFELIRDEILHGLMTS